MTQTFQGTQVDLKEDRLSVYFEINEHLWKCMRPIRQGHRNLNFLESSALIEVEQACAVPIGLPTQAGDHPNSFAQARTMSGEVAVK